MLSGEDKAKILDPEDVLRINSLVCIPKVSDLAMLIMKEYHSFRYFVHLGAINMYHYLKQHYYWCGMKRDILELWIIV